MMKFGVRRQNHAYEAGQVIKCLISLRKSKIADDNVLKMDIPPYLHRESSKVDEIWYPTQTQILTQPRKHDKHKSEINIKRANIIFLNY